MLKIQHVIGVSFHLAAILLSVVILIPALCLSYWFLDRRPPIDNVSGWFERWEPADPHIAIIAWKADRERLCEGTAVSWVFADRPWVLASYDLPPPGAETHVGVRGAVWTVPMAIPGAAIAKAGDKLVLRVRFTWACNPVHHYWPLEFNAPDIVIPVSHQGPEHIVR